MKGSERYERGMEMLYAVDGKSVQGLMDVLGKASPALAGLCVEFPFGDVYTRPELDLRQRELITLAALAVLRAEPQLMVHVRGALNVGVTREEVMEVFVHMAVYAGFPAAIQATLAAWRVFGELDAEKGGAQES